MARARRGSVRDYAGVTEAELQAMLALVAGTDIDELDLRVGRAELRIRRDLSGVAVVAGPEAAPADGDQAAAALDAAENAATVEDEGQVAVTSPLVGYVHPSVAVGDEVAAGQVLGRIDSMGMPTSVEAPHAGAVEEVLTADGAPVEYGQPLLVLRRPAE